MSKTVSIVVPCFNEAEVLPLLYERLRALPKIEGIDYQFLLVDDGSTDSTWQQISSFSKSHPNWKSIRLTRNFGHQKALWIGFQNATGDAVFVIDADLQDPPELIESFVSKWLDGNDVVFGVRKKRKENFIKKAAYKSFYRLLANVADIEIPLDSGDFCLMDRKVVDAMLRANEPEPFIRGARAWVGFDQIGLEYERDARAAGVEKYGIRQLFELAFNGIFSYSKKPIRAIVVLGFSLLTFSLIWATVFLTIGLATGSTMGWSIPSIVLGGLILGMTGVQLIALGVIGEYVGKIFESVSQRPPALVKEVGSDSRESSLGENLNTLKFSKAGSPEEMVHESPKRAA